MKPKPDAAACYYWGATGYYCCAGLTDMLANMLFVYYAVGYC